MTLRASKTLFHNNYKKHRNKIKTGDLLIWSDNYGSFLSKLFLSIVRFFTRSEFAHVGIAIVKEDRLYVLEATIPEIQLIPVSSLDEFYHLPLYLDLEPNDDRLGFLYDKIGLPYSMIDAVKAYLGITNLSNKKWQCAELANKFYKHIGLNFGRSYTPTKLVNRIMKETGYSLVYVRKE